MSNSNENTGLETAGEVGSRDALLPPDMKKALEELHLIEQIVSELTGLPSNWNGNVELHTEPGWRGMKPFRCDIRLDSARQELDVRGGRICTRCCMRIRRAIRGRPSMTFPAGRKA